MNADTSARTKRKAFLCSGFSSGSTAADRPEVAWSRLFAINRLDPSLWKCARTFRAIEHLNKEFRRRIKTQTVLPRAGIVPMRLWTLLASGKIWMRKVYGWETLSQPIELMPQDLTT